MITFLESLKLRKIEECLILMEINGISSLKFVNWYCEEGNIYQEQGLLKENLENWFNIQLNEYPDFTSAMSGTYNQAKNSQQPTDRGLGMGKAIGNYLKTGAEKAGEFVGRTQQFVNNVGTGINNALGISPNQQNSQQSFQPQQPNYLRDVKKALSTLSMRMERDPEFSKKINDPEFENLLWNALGMLKNESIIINFMKDYEINGKNLTEGAFSDWWHSTRLGNAIGNFFYPDKQKNKNAIFNAQAVQNCIKAINNLGQGSIDSNLQSMLQSIQQKLNQYLQNNQAANPQAANPWTAYQRGQRQLEIDKELESWPLSNNSYNPKDLSDKEFFESICGKTKKTNWFAF